MFRIQTIIAIILAGGSLQTQSADAQALPCPESLQERALENYLVALQSPVEDVAASAMLYALAYADRFPEADISPLRAKVRVLADSADSPALRRQAGLVWLILGEPAEQRMQMPISAKSWNQREATFTMLAHSLFGADSTLFANGLQISGPAKIKISADRDSK